MNNQIQDLSNKLYSTLKEENNNKNIIISNAGDIVNKSISALSYVTKNYPNAPPLKEITNYDFILNTKEEFIKNSAHYYEFCL